MNFIRTLAEAIGFAVIFLFLLGALGIGHFRLYYGTKPPAQEQQAHMPGASASADAPEED